MSASALLRHGPGYAVAMLDELDEWLDERGFDGVDEVRGRLAVPEGADGAAVERAGYVGVPPGGQAAVRPLVASLPRSERGGACPRAGTT